MDDQVLSDLLTAKQAGVILGVNPVTVTRWAKAGELAYIIVPPYGRRMYQRAVIQDHADRRRHAGE